MTEHEIRKVEVEAFVYSRETPTDEQLKKVQDFLEKKYNAAVAVIPKQDDSVRDGFRIEIGTSTYKWNLDRIFDWSAEGRAKQLKQSISEAIRGKQDVLPMIRQAIEDFEPVPKDEEVGTVLTVGDGIATISGLEDAEYGEIDRHAGRQRNRNPGADCHNGGENAADNKRISGCCFSFCVCVHFLVSLSGYMGCCGTELCAKVPQNHIDFTVYGLCSLVVYLADGDLSGR